MIYEITNPQTPMFQGYVNNRDFSIGADNPEAGDLGPKGLTFIPWYLSPIRKPLPAVGNEASGTNILYQIKVNWLGRCSTPRFAGFHLPGNCTN